MLRPRYTLSSEILPPEPWAVETVRFDRDLAEQFAGQGETMFALSNGYLGVRGMFDEGTPVKEPGVFLNGFFEFRPITYGEHAYGFPRRGQSILNCPDGTIMKLFVGDEPFTLSQAKVLSYRRRLDLQNATLVRDVCWAAPSGQRLRLTTTRLVSLADRHLAAIAYELRAEDGEADVLISSELAYRPPLPLDIEDPRLAAGFTDRVLRPAGTSGRGPRAVLSYCTRRSKLLLACGVDHAWTTDGMISSESTCTEDLAVTVFKGTLRRGESIRIEKYLAYHYGDDAASTEIKQAAQTTLDRAREQGFAGVAARQKTEAAEFWRRADITVVTDDPRTQQVVRWNLFQLLQASERVEGHGIAARGLTGQSYEGHYFWDTEIYVLPFLVYTQPRIARALLQHRYGMLDKARVRARELGHAGAIFPWRTINGEEASAYYAAGTAQYHINADIAYAVRKYVEVSGDEAFLWQTGAEILVETARLWRDLGFFSDRHDGRFCINGVTGPDEYTALVNNNYFTNLMARENLRYAADTLRAMARACPEALADLAHRTGLSDEEPASWEEAADRMYLPYDERLGIRPQDEDFLDLEPWDFANTPQENYPLLLHYHPLNLYRSQVIKQADTVLAMFLLGSQFTVEEKKRNFDYYDPLTTHDSSLSVCIQSIVANEIGYRRKALRYFRFAAVMDLSDVGGNMMHGAHIASIGGTWMALVYGFAGLRDDGGRLSFRPRLPDEWSRLAFCLTVQGRRLRVEIDRDMTSYELLAGAPLALRHDGAEITLSAQAPLVRRPTPKPPPEPLPDFADTAAC